MAIDGDPRVSVVVPTHRRVEGLRRLVKALSSQTLPAGQSEVVLVDDGSGRDIAAAIDQIAADAPLKIKVIHLDPGRGPAGARNAGWRAASSGLIAFTDDDCVPEPGWLEAGLAGFIDADVGVVQGRTVRPSDSPGYPYTPFTVIREVLAPSPWFEGCNIFYRRAALEEAGGFPERFGRFPCGEDTYLGWDVVDQGWQRAWAPDAVVEHELSERPWSWHLRFHWREGELVRLAAEHPNVRAWFWRPWAIKPENAKFAAAALGAVGSLRWRPALLATVPYLLWLAPGRKAGKHGLSLQVSNHAASLAAKVITGVRERTFLV